MATTTVDVSGGAPAPGFRWKSEWTDILIKWVLGGIIAGASAAVSFYGTIQAIRGDVATLKLDVVAIRALDAQQTTQIERLQQRQADDDNLHGREDERNKAIQQRLDQIVGDIRDFRRDLTGRVR